MSVVQLITALGGTVAVSPSSTSSPTTASASDDKSKASIRAAAFAFFLVGTAFAAIALVCHIVLTRLPFYQLVVVGKGGLGVEGKTTPKSRPHSRSGSRSHLNGHAEDDDDAEKPSTSIRAVEPKIRVLGISVFWVFFVSLCIFPSISASILSTNDPSTSPTSDPSSSSTPAPLWTQPLIFVALHFVVFNFGDWAGRSLPQIPVLVFRGKWKLAIASGARTLFIPLFLVCNVQAGDRDPKWILIRSDVGPCRSSFARSELELTFFNRCSVYALAVAVCGDEWICIDVDHGPGSLGPDPQTA